MSFELLPALAAGLVGTMVMTAMMQAAAKMGITEMPPMTLVTGSMMTADPDRARRMGTMIHFIVMGTVVFGLAYAAIFTAVDSASVGTGALVGAIHGVIVGALAMPMMPAVHPRMTADPLAGTVRQEGSHVVLSRPGFFGARWGAMTPVGLVVGHVVYGLFVALVYTALI